jgi:phosphoglycerate kinase
MMELKAFRNGSEEIARFIVDNKLDSVVGGGDTVELLARINLMNGFTHVSTGGGASLELMSGMELPGLEALLDKRPKSNVL